MRSPEQGADLRQSDQVDTSLRSANTEGGLLLQSDRTISYCACVHARPFFKESLIISSAVAVGSFVPTLRFETLEIHKVCLRISNLDLAQNLSPSTLVNFIVGRLATGRHLPMRHRTNHHN